MSGGTDTNERRGTLYALSESSPVRLSLALVLVGGVVWLANALSTLRTDIDAKYVSREVFNVRMDGLERSVSDLKLEVQRLQDIVRQLERSSGK